MDKKTPLTVALEALDELLKRSKDLPQNQRLHMFPLLLTEPTNRENLQSIFLEEDERTGNDNIRSLTVCLSFAPATGHVPENPASCRFWFHADASDLYQYRKALKDLLAESGFAPEDEGFPMTLPEYMQNDSLDELDFFYMRDRIRYQNSLKQQFDFKIN